MRGFDEFAGRTTRLIYNKGKAAFVLEGVQHPFLPPRRADAGSKAPAATPASSPTQPNGKSRLPNGGQR